MGNPLKKAGEWLASALADKIMEPITALTERVDKLEQKHDNDEAALECDLSVLDDRICYLIDKARERGYTIASERRRVHRMHQAYHSRGGNHGEENEYKIYCGLPTEEEWRRHHAKDHLIGT